MKASPVSDSVSGPGRIPGRYLAALGGLYAAQGLVAAFFLNFLQGYLRGRGVTEDTAINGIQSIALLPFVFKFAMGPISDRWSLCGAGRRRPYLALGLGVMGLGLWGLTGLDPEARPGWFTAAATLAVAGLAAADTVGDGLAIDATPAGDRARVQGLLQGGRFLAIMASALGFGAWLEGGGAPEGILWFCGAWGLGCAGLAWWAGEPSAGSGSGSGGRFDWGAFRVLLAPRSLGIVGFGLWYGILAHGAEINLANVYGRWGFEEGWLGGLAAARAGGRALGALTLPLALPFLGRGRSVALGMICLGLAIMVQGAGESRGAWGAGALGACLGWAYGFNDALFFLLAMEASHPAMAASTFALFMAATNLSVTGGTPFAWLREALGGRDDWTYAAFGALALPGAFLGSMFRGGSRPRGGAEVSG